MEIWHFATPVIVSPANEHSVSCSREEAIAIAQAVAAEESWPWKEPVRVSRRPRGLWRPREWVVMSDGDCRGQNVWVSIDETTGAVLTRGFSPR
jgi:hypothetical protein